MTSFSDADGFEEDDTPPPVVSKPTTTETTKRKREDEPDSKQHKKAAGFKFQKSDFRKLLEEALELLKKSDIPVAVAIANYIPSLKIDRINPDYKIWKEKGLQDLFGHSKRTMQIMFSRENFEKTLLELLQSDLELLIQGCARMVNNFRRDKPIIPLVDLMTDDYLRKLFYSFVVHVLKNRNKFFQSTSNELVLDELTTSRMDVRQMVAAEFDTTSSAYFGPL